ncbi:hypothetical protein FISHEDRAFT_72135 [Fistulina hepatica ATCC 64428]|uniref:Uncharacterized protein n=1 Tax=Fistulina hepatica ATCC 64428 TaxID=1128425 RepID=A0A0D7AGE1_9AGAR|nr:hypothetical protein FISHEDRAFT_72135 [Fistulina hepatica ATCC 64428]
MSAPLIRSLFCKSARSGGLSPHLTHLLAYYKLSPGEIRCSNPVCTTVNAPRPSTDPFPCSSPTCGSTYRMSSIGAARYRQWMMTSEARRVEYEVVGLKIKTHAAALYLRANHRLCTETRCLHYNVAPMATGTHKCTGIVDGVACPGFFSAGPQTDEVYNAWARQYPSVFPQQPRNHSNSHRGRVNTHATAFCDARARKSSDSDKTLVSTIGSDATLASVAPGSVGYFEFPKTNSLLGDNDFVLLPKIGGPGVPFPAAGPFDQVVTEDSAFDRVIDEDATERLVSHFSPPTTPESAHFSLRNLRVRTLSGKAMMGKMGAAIRRPFRSKSSSNLLSDQRSIAPSVVSMDSKSKHGPRRRAISKPLVGVELATALDHSFAAAIRPPPVPRGQVPSFVNSDSRVLSSASTTSTTIPPVSSGVTSQPISESSKVNILPDPAALARRPVRPRAQSVHSGLIPTRQGAGVVSPVPPLPNVGGAAAASGTFHVPQPTVPVAQKI